jgi:hypothetical protein
MASVEPTDERYAIADNLNFIGVSRQQNYPAFNDSASSDATPIRLHGPKCRSGPRLRKSATLAFA